MTEFAGHAPGPWEWHLSRANLYPGDSSWPCTAKDAANDLRQALGSNQ